MEGSQGIETTRKRRLGSKLDPLTKCRAMQPGIRCKISPWQNEERPSPPNLFRLLAVS